MTTKIKAVAYYRMSSDKQETSIDDQRTAVEAFAAANGYNITGEYLDEGISGWKSAQRHGFQQLIADAERKEFQAVLCWDQDRFSRFAPLEANHYWYLLDRAGVHIATVAQGRLNFEDLGEWLKASVTQHGKAEYLKDLGRNTARGMLKMKQAGRWLSNAPIGYRLENGRLQIGSDTDVATIQRIFGLRSKGRGCLSIAQELNASKIPTPRGGYWHSTSVRHLLKNPVYIGHTVLGKHARGKYARVLDGIVTIENTHPAIVDPVVWADIQSMWSTAERKPMRKGAAPLSGLLVCGRCGKPMYAGPQGTYRCSTYHTGLGCGCCAVKRDAILGAVAAKIRERVLLGSVDRLEAAIQQQIDSRRAPKEIAEDKQRKLAALDRQISRAADRILSVDDSLVSDLEQRLLVLKQQRSDLAASIDGNAATTRQLSAKEIAAKIWELDRILREASPETVRHALAKLVDHVRLDFEPKIGAGKTRQCYRFIGGTIRLVQISKNRGPRCRSPR